MGIADAIPGVSGGTIALLLGIYEELISTISGLNFGLITKLKNNGFKSFWESIMLHQNIFVLTPLPVYNHLIIVPCVLLALSNSHINPLLLRDQTFPG